MEGKGRIFPRSFEGQAPREFGQDANILQIRTFDLTVALNLEEIAIGGSCIWAVAATSLGAYIDIRINDQLRGALTFQQGMFIRGVPFSCLYVSHAAQPGETLTIFFAVEEDTRNIQITNPSISANLVNLTKPTVYETLADVTMIQADTTQILAANDARRVAYITNLLGNANTLRIADAGALAGAGTPLAPGDTLTIETIEAIWGFNPAGVNQDVAVTWTED